MMMVNVLIKKRIHFLVLLLVNLQNGPFKSFKGTWLFEVIELEKTRIIYNMEYQIVNPLTEFMVKQQLAPFMDQFVGEFVKKFKAGTTN